VGVAVGEDVAVGPDVRGARGFVGRWEGDAVGDGSAVLGATTSERGCPARRPLASPTPYARPLVPTSSTTNMARADHFRIIHLTSHMFPGRLPRDHPDAPTAEKVAAPRLAR
jgi:hypothetical protein